MVSRLLKNIGLFCKRALQKRLYSAKETYILKELTNHSHPISDYGKGTWMIPKGKGVKIDIHKAKETYQRDPLTT